VPAVAETITGIRALIAEEKSRLVAAGTLSPKVSFVATMGALHAGHLALVKRAKKRGDIVVVSIFVNPTQFTPTEDLSRYPRDLAADLRALNGSGTTFVFAPTLAEIYPHGTTDTIVSAGRVGGLFEGRTRAGHFDGVLTVVTKLANIIRPDVFVFGQKDAQQAFLVNRMLTDLNFPISFEVVPTVREDDGLALSSRNRFLDERERRAAIVLAHMLEAAGSAADLGIDAVIAAAQSVSMGEPLVTVDYFGVVNPATFLPVDDDYRGPATAIVAARVGATRLIDNAAIHLA
jgi:pantoate--beta-alanine ligase